jgi:hypothetical protein
MLVTEEMRDIALSAGEKVVDADDIAAPLQEALAQMGAEKSGPAGDENALFKVHGTATRASGPFSEIFTLAQSALQDHQGENRLSDKTLQCVKHPRAPVQNEPFAKETVEEHGERQDIRE